MFCEVDGSRFKRLFGACARNINGFKLGCWMILFISTHLSRAYIGIMLAVIALHADNLLFNFTYAIVSAVNIDEWV